MEAKTRIEQWGISLEEVDQLGERLIRFYERFRSYLQTKTRNTSEYGLGYLSGLLRMETKRNMANVGRKTAVSGQNLQHFMSNSPWSGRALIEAIQNEIKGHPAFQEAMLVLDESAEAKAGEQIAGAGRQYNGRMGAVEVSQVGVFLSWSPRRSTPGSMVSCSFPPIGLKIAQRRSVKRWAFPKGGAFRRNLSWAGK